MKIKIKIAITFILFFSTFSAFCNDNLKFNISPYASYKYINLEEFFFSDIRTNEKISLLDWTANPLWSLGLRFDSSYKKLNLGFDFSYSLPFQCGIMKDSDWDVLNGLKVIYSESEIHNKNSLSAALSISYNIYENNFLSFLPLLDFDYRYFTFEARNGYGWYGLETKTHGEVAWNDPLAKYYAPGQLNGLDFTKHSFESFIGFTLRAKIKRININTSALISPFSYFYTMDIHLSKISNYHYEQVQYAVLQRYKINLEFMYTINKSFSPFISLSFNSGSALRGKLYSENPSSPSKKIVLMSQDSGSRQTIFSINTGVTIHI